MSSLLNGKVIVSNPLPPIENDGSNPLVPLTVKQISYLAFRTRYEGKTVLTGIGIGRVGKKGKLKTTPTANGVLKTMAKAPEFTGRLLVVECRNLNTATLRITAILNASGDGDGLMIICKDSELYDEIEIFKLLGVEKA